MAKLSADQERWWADLKNENLSAEERAIAKKNFAESFLWIVGTIVSRLGVSKDQRDDAYQVGALHLLEKLDHWQRDRGDFVNYVWPFLRHQILRFLNADKGSRYLQEYASKAIKLEIDSSSVKVNRNTLYRATFFKNPRVQGYELWLQRQELEAYPYAWEDFPLTPAEQQFLEFCFGLEDPPTYPHKAIAVKKRHPYFRLIRLFFKTGLPLCFELFVFCFCCYYLEILYSRHNRLLDKKIAYTSSELGIPEEDGFAIYNTAISKIWYFLESRKIFRLEDL